MSPVLQFALAAALLLLVIVLVALGRAAGRPRDLVAVPPADRSDGGAALGGGPPPAQVMRLIQQRRKIDAIRVLRRHTGLPLAEAKRVVDHLSAGGSPPPWFATMGPVEAPAKLPVDDGVRADVVALARQGKKIQAIKLVRHHTGWKLAEAKRYVESL